MRSRTISILAMLTISLFVSIPAIAQVEKEEISLDYEFAQRLTISAAFPRRLNISAVEFFILPEGELLTRAYPASEGKPNLFTAAIDLQQDPLRAFSLVDYWYRAELNTGEVITSTADTLYYEDNRFDWVQKNQAPFSIHRYAGDELFAQEMVDVAQQGLENIQRYLPLVTPEKVDIYAYANTADMRDSLQLSTSSWIGAHADPDLSVMVISLPSGPDQHLEMERQIPHELMHIMLYHHIGKRYINLPVWLVEGLASIVELYPNPDYAILLSSAVNGDNLLEIQSLCTNFPSDATDAYLAYAQAESFTRYLYDHYGDETMETLVATYSSGVDCERGVEMVFGKNLAGLQTEWFEDTFDANGMETGIRNLVPWILLLIVVIGGPISVAIIFFVSKREIQ